MKTEYKHYYINIEQDLYAESPREWETFGTIVSFMKQRYFGDQHFSSYAEFLSDICETKKSFEENYIYLEVYAYIHSGITIKTTPFTCPFDSGLAGLIYVKKDRLEKEGLGDKDIDYIHNLLSGEITLLDQFLQGEVYYYEVTDKFTGEILDSCHGFYGEDGALQEAQNMCDHLAK